MQRMTKPTVKYNPFGESGNIYWIIAAAQRALEKQGKDVDIFTQVEEGSRNYTHALQIIGEHVRLVDTSK